MQRLEGSRAHFHLYRDQCLSDCQTVWDGSLLECNKTSIFLFDHRMCESWDFGQFSKKFDKKWTLEVADLVKKNFQKIQKNDEHFFSLFLFLLCSIECIVLPRFDTMSRNPFLPPLYSQMIRQIPFWKWCENL